MKNRYWLIIVTLLLFLALAFRGGFHNTVIFAGDEWEYQVIAVNHYYGHGFLTTGKIEETGKYRFSQLSTDKLKFWENKSGKAYYRSPFYPAFLILCYKIFGVNPLAVKLLQLVLVFMAGLLLIRVGEQLYGNKGFIIGSVSYLFFIFINYRFAEHLMPENWQLVWISLILIFLSFHYSNRPVYSVALGAVLGISVLNKGTTFLIFPIVILCDACFIMMRKHRFVNTILLMLPFLIITVGWSLYLSKQTNAWTYISTQSKDVLLDGNNEYCTDGAWHPEWRNNIHSFYYQEHIRNLSPLKKVSLFYVKNPDSITNLVAKIYSGFSSLLTIHILLGLFFTHLSIRLLTGLSNGVKTTNQLSLWMMRVVPGLLFLLLVFFFMTLNANEYACLLILFLLLQTTVFRYGLKKSASLPLPFMILLTNFLIFTILFYTSNEVYTSRFVKMTDGIVLLTITHFIMVSFPELAK
jgi:4-amino-4-deoxy-L-arabinose transferase-like glycosyltransferase